jgi:hypothetical protein
MYYFTGRNYAWTTWEVLVPDFNPADCGEIMVRAFDSAANGMSAEHEWNLTGMMNNCYFKIKVVKSFQGYVFQHPTTWMDPEAKKVLVYFVVQ